MSSLGAVLAALAFASMTTVAPIAARELAGFRVPESVKVEPEGATLTLIGAHVRTYLFRDVSLFALYAAERPASFDALIASSAPKRVAVTILRPTFTAERFRAGWREQFDAVLSEAERARFSKEIAEFIGTFETLNRGETITFDFTPGKGVRFSIRGEPKRVIDNDEFAAALLGVWMGPRSVDPELRRKLLGAETN